MHRRADKVNAQWNQRVKIVVERIAERGRKQHSAHRSGLMVVVYDLREPVVEKHPIDRFGFRLIGHVEVAVVVVTDILLIKPRQSGGRSLQRVLVAHVPV